MVNSGETATSSSPNRKGEMRFCPYCGTKLDAGAKFCKSCGEPIGSANQGKSSASATAGRAAREDPITERKTVYEGYIHKCPNCGEVLESFIAVCPSCGYEIRDGRTSNSVQEFALRLERVESQKMPAFEEKKSVMKMVFGKDFKDTDEVEEAKKHFEEQKQQEKASLIINYSVPNTREDILEFMLLACSNIDVKHGIGDTVSKAWISKLEQVYQKAELSMGNGSDFGQIKSICDNKKRQIRNKKLKGVFGWAAGIAAWFFLIGLLWNPAAAVPIFVVVAVLLIVGYILLSKR